MEVMASKPEHEADLELKKVGEKEVYENSAAENNEGSGHQDQELTNYIQGWPLHFVTAS